MRSVFIALALFLAVSSAQAQSPKTYPDGRGGKVTFPLGDVSFADEVVSLDLKEPRAGERNSQPEAALGIPDYKSVQEDTYVTLSCGGTLALRFTDNALVDVPGPDLYVFEIGPAVEATILEISADGEEWLEVGRISGGRADVDINEHVQPGDVFHYVRLTDGKGACHGRWPGADIDAVGAIGAAVQFSLNGSVLFDTAKWDLKPEAQQELDELAEKLLAYGSGSVVIEGHTDSVGSDADNKTLSENRAQSVRDYLAARADMSPFTISARGYGESRPTATNDTEEGRAKNRRVDVVLTPGGK